MSTGTNESSSKICLVCHKNTIEYCGLCCGKPSLCKRCAMKQATGGRCRVCSVMFGQLKRIDPFAFENSYREQGSSESDSDSN